MKIPFASKNFSPSVRRSLELSVAVSQERILATQVEHALQLIDLIGDRVPVERALDIYVRLLRLTPDEARIIATRALAKLGERTSEAEAWPSLMAEREGGNGGWSQHLALLNQVRNRMRGRVNGELRGWIELEAARTETALLEAHVNNAMSFVDILHSDVPFSEAVELYLDSMDVRDSIAEIVYCLTLTKLSEELLPQPRDIPAIAAAAIRDNPAPPAASAD